jgi:tRNA nucleotidyltransferase (CCA-adding enzyme)
MTFSNEITFAQHIAGLGGMAWVVGGAVRDELLGIESHDRDFVVTGLDTMPFSKVVGADFPVFLVTIDGKTCEVALARKERKTGSGHTGFVIDADKSITIEQDLARRDLTINSMALNILTGEVVDPFEGRADLNWQILRHTTAAFAEDPLRVFRVARFASRWPDFVVHPDTIALMATMKEEIRTLTVERVWKELEKALETDTPSRFFRVLLEANLLDVHFPEVTAMNVPDMHDGTALNHTLTVMDGGSGVLTRFGLLCHDFGKGSTPAADHPKHHGHDELGVPLVEALCTRLKAPTAFREIGVLACETHMKLKKSEEMRAGKLLRLIMDNDRHIEKLILISWADSARRAGANVDEERLLFSRLAVIVGLARKTFRDITGQMLLDEGMVPGPAFGATLFGRRVHHFQGLLRTMP